MRSGKERSWVISLSLPRCEDSFIVLLRASSVDVTACHVYSIDVIRYRCVRVTCKRLVF